MKIIKTASYNKLEIKEAAAHAIITPEIGKKVIDMYKSGKSIKEIANNFSVNYGSIRKYLVKNKIQLESHKDRNFMNLIDSYVYKNNDN